MFLILRESTSPNYGIELYHDYHEFITKIITNLSRIHHDVHLEEFRVLDIEEEIKCRQGVRGNPWARRLCAGRRGKAEGVERGGYIMPGDNTTCIHNII